MSVSLTPSSILQFHGPLSQAAKLKRVLTLKNNNDQCVIFKVLTTVPKFYAAQPSHGMIGPKESFEVQVILRAGNKTPPLKGKGSFVILSTVIAPEKESVNVRDQCKSLGKADCQVHKRRFPVAYLPAVDVSSKQTSLMEGNSRDAMQQEAIPNAYADNARAAQTTNQTTPEQNLPIKHPFSPSSDRYKPNAMAQGKERTPEYLFRQPTLPLRLVNVPSRCPSPRPLPSFPVPMPSQAPSVSEHQSVLYAQLSEAHMVIHHLRDLLASIGIDPPCTNVGGLTPFQLQPPPPYTPSATDDDCWPPGVPV